MGNIIDYVKTTKDLTFEDRGFTVEDALVLAEFCYLKFDGLVGSQSGENVPLAEIDKSKDKENLFAIKSYAKDNRKLYKAVISSRRFNEMKIGGYVNHVDAKSETQFAAVTFFLPCDITYIAYRGTDETMAGWQEDFSLALKRPIIGQTLATAYLNEAAERITGNIMLGGHSKGGNVAMYASMCAKPSVKERISKIYSFDGPGFRPEFFDEKDYNDIKDKLVRIMPKSSPVGLIFNAPGEYEVIESKSVGVLQHNPYNWVIKKDKLSRAKMTDQHLLTVRTINEWILSLDDKELDEFVNMLCWVLDATEASTTEEFKKDVAGHARAVLEAEHKLDDTTREMANFFVKSYMELAGEMVRDEVVVKYEAVIGDMNKLREEMALNMKERSSEVKTRLENTKGKIENSFEETKGRIEGSFSKK